MKKYLCVMLMLGTMGLLTACGGEKIESQVEKESNTETETREKLKPAEDLLEDMKNTTEKLELETTEAIITEATNE